MEEVLNSLVKKHIDSEEIQSIALIQNLWSGYGSLNRIKLKNKTIIVKLIKFPDQGNHPRGWNSSFSHQRKEKSYRVEMNFYQNYNDIPKCVATGITDEFQYLILEDLLESGHRPKGSINWNEVQACLKWLAQFHLKFYSKKPEGLWEVGTYWHLATRPDELEIMDDLELKNAASAIDKKLNEAKHQTFVHGDAKLANFLFSDTGVAAVDYQYVGGGVGIKDVAYFMSSIYDENELQSYEEKCLHVYFKELNNPEIEKEWRELYPYAWCDFYRFLKGWAPDHYKINTYSDQMRQKVLKWI